MRRILIISAAATAMLAAASAATAQTTNTFAQEESTAWDDDRNWDQGHKPTIDEDVVIPISLSCGITTENAVARTVTVTGSLGVYGGYTLLIRTPNDSQTPTLTVNGQLGFNGIATRNTLRIEMTGDGARVAEVTGSGLITGVLDGATLETDSGSNAVDRVHVDDDISVWGDWIIKLHVENDGFFATGGDYLIMTFSDDGSTLGLSGNGLFLCAAGFMTFDCIDYEPGGTFDGTLQAVGGTMIFTDCGSPSKPNLEAATLIADGGDMQFDDGFTSNGATITFSEGFVSSDGDILIDSTDLTVDGIGVLLLDTANLWGDDGSTVLVEDDGALATPTGGLLAGVFGGNDVIITVDDYGQLICDVFFLTDEAAVYVASGMFSATGDINSPSAADPDASITISGGVFEIAGGFEGDQSDLSMIAGRLEILQSAANGDVFHNGGGQFFFGGGTIKVEDGERLLID